MIKFTSTDPETGRRMLGIGLSRGNVGLLTEGHPIHFTAEEMGLPDIRVSEILIMFGETESAITEELMRVGNMTPETRVIVEPERKRH